MSGKHRRKLKSDARILNNDEVIKGRLIEMFSAVTTTAKVIPF